MAATYYYNVYLQQFLNGVWVNITAQAIKMNFNEFRDSGNNNVSPTNQAGNQQGSQSDFQWVVKAYKKENGVSTQLNDDKVKVDETSTGTKNDYDGVITYNNIYFGIQINKTLLNTHANKFPRVLKPVIKVTHKGGTLDGEEIALENIVGRSFTGIQTVTFTKATTYPEIPTALITEVSPAPTSGQDPIKQTFNIHYDAKLKQYVGIKTQYNSGNGKTTYIALYYNPGSDGTKIKQVTVGTDQKGKGKDGMAYKAAQAILINAIDSATVTNVRVPDGNDGSTDDKPGYVAPKEPKGADRWNPPAHVATKGRLRGFEWVDKDNSVGDNTAEVVSKVVAAGELGRIYQDKNSAKAVNTNTAVSKPGELWGFRFMYNPTTISYNTSGVPYDYTNTADPAILLTGNMQVQFQLYLNRIVDLTELQSKNSPISNPYTPPLNDAAKKGILNRGTEYDLEFLYRVCNGDPRTDGGIDPLLGYNGITADTGVLKLVPVWIHLNNSFKIFGSVANLSVNHVLFDKRMVPMLSTVDITINRYPAVFNLSDTNPDAQFGANEFKKLYGDQGNNG